MRVIVVNSFYYPEIYGGAEISVKLLAEELLRQGHDILVLSTGDEFKTEYVNGVKVVRIKPVELAYREGQKKNPFKSLVYFMETVWNIRNYKMINKVIKEFKPDLVHTNGIYHLSPIVWKIAKKNKARVVHTIRDMSLICKELHLGCKNNFHPCGRNRAGCISYREINKLTCRYVDCFTAPSKFIFKEFAKYSFLKKVKKVVIPNAILTSEQYDDLFWKCKKENILAANRVRFAFLGTLDKKKGIDWLINSFEKIDKSKAELRIFGKGPLADWVKNKAEENENIIFENFLEQDELHKRLNDVDVIICPSLWPEAFGRVVLDSYINAIPVIASDVGALPEIVKNSQTGFIVEAGNVEKMILAINKYVDNKELIIEQGYNCVKELKRYSLKKQISNFVKNAYLC